MREKDLQQGAKTTKDPGTRRRSSLMTSLGPKTRFGWLHPLYVPLFLYQAAQKHLVVEDPKPGCGQCQRRLL